MIYFDHGATSFPKPKGVIEEMETCLRSYCGNPGRSGHKMSFYMAEKIYETRKQLATFFGIKDPSHLLFTKNTTESLNLAMFGFLKAGDHVVTTSMEHNSVLRPLRMLEKKGIAHTIVKGDLQGFVKTADVEAAIEPHTRLIVITAASNVTGTKQPVKEIGRIARKHGVCLLVDGAQAAGKLPLNLSEMPIDMLAFPGHKGLSGPPGTGGLYVSPHIKLQPLLFGGTGTMSNSIDAPMDFPEGYEAGTLNGPGIVGLGKGVSMIAQVGLDTLMHHERTLIAYLEDYLREMKRVTCYGPESKDKTGICLFNIQGLSSEDVTRRLSREYDIAVRGGFHCAGLAHQTIGTGEEGAVRLSVGAFNTRKEIKKAVEGIWKLSKGI